MIFPVEIVGFTNLTHTHIHSSYMTAPKDANKGHTILASHNKKRIVAGPALISPERLTLIRFFSLKDLLELTKTKL